MLSLSFPAAGAATACIYEDAQVAGKQMHAFRADGELVTIVLGDFSLSAGPCTISGRDGVVWIRTETPDRATRHHLTVYAEGDARAVDADGTTTLDASVLVSLVTQGRFTAHGPVTERDLSDFPLYQRAVAARRGVATRPATAPAGPPLIHVAHPTTAAATRPTTTQPGMAPVPPVPSAARPLLPVHVSGNAFESKLDDGERVVIVRGDVYLSQGNPESKLFVEIRSQAAVLFTRRLEEPKTSRSPVSPRMPDMGQETVTGAYLWGDVVIARGERYLRCNEAFHDFLTDRTYAPEAVFRTIQEQRNIPIYIRAKVVRALSARELYFRDARVTTSDFFSPTYDFRARTTYLMDQTPYDIDGEPIGPRSWRARMTHTTFNVRGVPVSYWPYWEADFAEIHTPLRKVQVGRHSRFGFGLETEWHLFRLLGLVGPPGVQALVELDWYEQGLLAGVRWNYAREAEARRYSGYGRLFGLVDGSGADDFGDARRDITAPPTRGRALWRHKEYLPRGWEAQFELSYLCDENFLEQYWRTEFFAGKEQETLIYAKKQQDNWALEALLQYRLNRFDTQTESLPDLAFHLVGQPLLKDTLTVFSESHLGLKRYRPADDSGLAGSPIFPRADTRNEVDLPIRIGPVKIVPYAVGRASWWGDEPAGGQNARLYGQVGVRASTTLWRLYPHVNSRLWDLHGLRHVITPEVVAFLSDTTAAPAALWPLDPDIEVLLRRQSGVAVGVHQRLQTKRGPAGAQHVADWMRLSVVAGFYDNGPDLLPADGRFFFSRPEYSLGRNHVNVDYTWYVSDATTFVADLNYDVDDGKLGTAAAALSVVRSPRLALYGGMRLLPDMDSAIGTFGARYRVNRKYSVGIFEQYDFDFHGQQNLATHISVVRKLPRWYLALTFSFDQTASSGDDIGVWITLWPEGIPEIRLSGSRLSLLGKSREN